MACTGLLVVRGGTLLFVHAVGDLPSCEHGDLLAGVPVLLQRWAMAGKPNHSKCRHPVSRASVGFS